ncbi:MAG TPA: sugar transferase [Acidimicrobiales bacterium]|nr:sugar transferase [Acidimicrobiales bacterium]
MARVVRLLIPALTAVIVLLIAAIHAQIHHYEVTNEPRFGWLLALIALIWIATYAAGVNEAGIGFGARLVRSAGAVGGAVVIISLLQLVVSKPPLPRFDLGLSVVVLIPGLAGLSALAQRSLTLQGEQERVVAVVDGEERERLTRDIGVRPEHHSLLVAAVAPSEITSTPERPTPLEELVDQRRITLVVLSREAQSLEDVVSQAASAHSHGIRIRTLSLFYDEWLGKLPLSELERIALLFDINEIHRPVYARMKRFLDVVLAIVGLPALLVAIPVVALVDLIGNRGPLFFHQERVGKDGKVFTIHKFRTMRPSSGPTDWTTPDDRRLGAVGRALRKLHIDELPQVWNVLRRDLSIVGPRPEQPRYVSKLSEVIPFYETRHLVRPGITGWAQVKYDYGASELDALEKLQYEFYYLRHQSLALDVRIIGRTLRSIVGLKGR